MPGEKRFKMTEERGRLLRFLVNDDFPKVLELAGKTLDGTLEDSDKDRLDELSTYWGFHLRELQEGVNGEA